MDIVSLLNTDVKSVEKRVKIVEAIQLKLVTIVEIQLLKNVVDDKKLALVLEAMEAVSNKNSAIATLEWLIFAQEFITSKSNNLKRESSRIVGNIAHMFPDHLKIAIQNLIENTKDSSTVIRWGSAYALARIIQIPQYANS
ncbi:MAG: hypothetical protein LBC03_04900, partial [Nitrososphaerota archaeon]|nr:hypothetical protein [Nitrososphaerota archaeon]